jgi:transposase
MSSKYDFISFIFHMSIGNINIEKTIANVLKLMEEENLSPAMKSALEVILLLVQLMVDRLGLNSTNSSIPPSKDQNRTKSQRKSTGKKKGGQKDHPGETLMQVAEPDEIKEIAIDQTTLPKGIYKKVGHEKRQVFDLDISVIVTEYRAEILENENGKRFTAPFPEGIVSPVQYGNTVKAHAVCLSQYQLLPYNRIEEYFGDQMKLPLSAGSIYNFNKKAFDLLSDFETHLKEELIKSPLIHADETGININGKISWLHVNANKNWTYFFPHQKRGTEAMDAMGVLPKFKGFLGHDHWKSYYNYQDVLHFLCNEHHLRELQRAYEQDKQEWAKEMQDFLLNLNKTVEEAGGVLSKEEAQKWKEKYRELIKKAEIECPLPKPPKEKKRGRIKRSKARNLLERFRDYEDDILRFVEVLIVPFTNNLAERDVRMTKVQQKISGCFRSFEGAEMFCRIRSYISSAKKQGFSASYALQSLFDGKNIFCWAE